MLSFTCLYNLIFQIGSDRGLHKTPYKKYKITEDDYRNREKWDDYVAALNEMVARTSTKHAPWNLIAANDKRFARMQVLKIVADALKKGLQDK